MRLKMTFQGMARQEHIPINYNYPISAWIYHLLYESSPEYADFLHERGYIGVDGKARKLFTFSRLNISPRAMQRGSHLIVTPQHRIDLLLASPMMEDFIQHLVIGLFQQQVLTLAAGGAVARLAVQSVEVCPTPEFTSQMRCRCLSPVVVTTSRDRDGKREKHYFRPDEPGLSEAIRLSLLKKYETIHHSTVEDTSLWISPDAEYIQRKGMEKVMTLVRLKEGRADCTEVKGFLAPFEIGGSIELIKTAWECGMGDQTSMGFGCVGVAEHGPQRTLRDL